MRSRSCLHASILAVAATAVSAAGALSTSSTAAAFVGRDASRTLRSSVRRRTVARSMVSSPPPSLKSGSEFARIHVGGIGDAGHLKRGAVETPEGLGLRQGSVTDSLPQTGSTLGMIVDEQREFEINLGRAVDTLKKDYPALLTKNPDFKIYHDDLEVIDPTGMSLHGLRNYKTAFQFIHAFVSFFYDVSLSSLSFRQTYDWARKCIRISWNVELVPKMLYGGWKRKLYVDGISEYDVERSSGLVTEHRVSHLLINNTPVSPEKGIFHALAEMNPSSDGESVPIYYHPQSEADKPQPVLEFRSWNDLSPFGRSQTSLFSADENAMEFPKGRTSFDRDAYDSKNKTRKKFGVPPLSPEEFIKIEDEVRAMDVMNKKKATYLAEQISQRRKDEKKGNFMSNLFGGVMKNGCESNFDCERPEVCCDLGFKKMCCSNGLGIVDGRRVEDFERALLRVPVPNDNYDRNPGRY